VVYSTVIPALKLKEWYLRRHFIEQNLFLQLRIKKTKQTNQDSHNRTKPRLPQDSFRAEQMLSSILFSKFPVLSRTNLDFMLQHPRKTRLLFIGLILQNILCKTMGLQVLETKDYLRSVTTRPGRDADHSPPSSAEVKYE
jgi:hypothetical protein